MSVRRTRQPRGDTGADGAAPAFSGARATTDNATSVPNSTPTAIVFDNGENYDTDGYFTIGSPTIFTIPSDGVYLFGAAFRFNGPVATSTSLAAYIDIDAGSGAYGRWEQTVVGVAYPVVRTTITDQTDLVAAQTIGLTVTQVQGAAGAMDVSGALWIVKLGTL